MPVGAYSQGVRVGNFYFFSGQIALDSGGNFHGESVEAECGQIFENVAAMLSTAGLGVENVVKTTIFLTKISDFERVNKVYANFFKNHRPARSCVEVSALPKNARVEIEVLAVADD